VELKLQKSDTVVECSCPRDETRRIQTQINAVIAAFVVCCLLVMCFATSYFANIGRADNFALDSRVNPNSDSAASLMRLPNIGPSRAGAIIEYRRQFATEGKDVFENAADLQKIKGIGPKTVETIRPWLCFE